ncbi:metallophosphoesterase family protein [Planctomicrobium sp. SH661]|uniref:metallophosphoesterase family protein n=1 Tax=Planctomicrobium sp. SH661 TaxID=3448124 RepID=UPI003F5C63DB
MSLYAIGDIHGCWTALQTLLDFVPVRPDDLVITLGDYVDRGPDSKAVVQWVMDASAAGECLPLRGNHEIMLLDALAGRMSLPTWLRFGGQEALDSYAPGDQPGQPEDVPIEHLRFLERELLPYYETRTHIFVHATASPHLPLAQQSEESLYWDRFDTLKPHQSGKIVICGHTAQKSGLPVNVGYGICLDTWAYGEGWLTCMNVDTGEYWQANQAGKTRTGGKLEFAST